ncbi:MAG TPA: VOC family protein [Caulobacteraceae bacterium]|jgi:catechol 2,3-dioxygenase|nr:VOC family protein [Caulobacteraceae bacterium]
MKIQSLGHVVLKVSDLARAEAFYAGVLGLPLCARMDQGGPKMAFFSLGNHHDFAVLEVGGEAATASGPGLHHVAFKIGDDLDHLREAKSVLEGAGIAVTPIDHEVTKSLYFHDPDGNEIEVYVDASSAWKSDPQRVAQIAPLAL